MAWTVRASKAILFIKLKPANESKGKREITSVKREQGETLRMYEL